MGLVVSYLLGSVPTAYILGRRTRGIDLRHHGSGNLGATNAFRVLGPYVGTLVLLIDIAKGTLAVLLADRVFGPQGPIATNLYLCLSAIMVVCGHNWTIFMKFKGGKGMATSLGVLVAFSMIIENFFLVVLAIIVLWLAIFLSSGIVSLASVIASALLPFIGISFHLPKTILGFLTILSAF